VFYPFDFSWAVGRVLTRIAPDLVVLAEGELWPNFLLTARRRGVPVVVVNGRLSPRSVGRHRRVRWLTRPLWRCLDLLAVQSREYAENLAAVGIPSEKIVVTGNIKYDGSQPERDRERLASFRALLDVRPRDRVWVCGSTQSPEEAVALSIFGRLRRVYPGMRLILVPRQKERFDEVATLLRIAGVPHVRRSSLTRPLEDRDAVVLVDTFGELEVLWGLAEVAFVGGSLDGKRGGQNLIQPAAYGSAVVFGPHTWNFRDAVTGLLQAGGALEVADADGLERAMRQLLEDGALRQRLGDNARRFVREQQGALARTMDAVDAVILTATRERFAA
jgi:3-deoxy-D-manno-octulosonic-acid transferase